MHTIDTSELQAAAVAYGQKVSLGRLQRSKRKTTKGSFADRYLSRWHPDNRSIGFAEKSKGISLRTFGKSAD